MKPEGKTIYYQPTPDSEVNHSFQLLLEPLEAMHYNWQAEHATELNRILAQLSGNAVLPVRDELALLGWAQDFLASITRSIYGHLPALGYDEVELQPETPQGGRGAPLKVQAFFESGTPEQYQYIYDEEKIRWNPHETNDESRVRNYYQAEEASDDNKWFDTYEVTTLCVPLTFQGVTRLPHPIWALFTTSRADILHVVRAEVYKHALARARSNIIE